MVTPNGSQGSRAPGGDGDENAEQRRSDVPRPVPTPAEVFPPHRKRPAPSPAQPDAEPAESGADGGEPQAGRSGENPAQGGR
jgi:hypothetical protein